MFNFKKKYFLVLGAFLFSGFSINAVPPIEVAAERLTEGQVCLACQEQVRPLVMAFECNDPRHAICRDCLSGMCFNSVPEFAEDGHQPVQLKCPSCRAATNLDQAEIAGRVLRVCSVESHKLKQEFTEACLARNIFRSDRRLELYQKSFLVFHRLKIFVDKLGLGESTLRGLHKVSLDANIITPSMLLESVTPANAAFIIFSDLRRGGEDFCFVSLVLCSLGVRENIIKSLKDSRFDSGRDLIDTLIDRVSHQGH